MVLDDDLKKDGFIFVGMCFKWLDGLDKVMGCVKFGVDMVVPGMLYGVILCSLYVYVCIKGINIFKVEVFEGVKVVVICVDFLDVV